MANASDTLKTTPLHETHQQLGARMMAFGGFDMPVQYSSIIEEHKAVRTAAGLFDISHMGEVMVRGPKAVDYVQHLVTNDASKLYDGRAMYTVMCQPDGGIIDDLIVYRIHEEHYMLVINAANIEKDVAWMRTHNTFDVTIEDVSDETALLALQGPNAFAIAQPFTDVDLDALKFYHFERLPDGAFLDANGVILSRTGYTGEPGLEIYCAPDAAAHIWTTLLDAGADHGLQPVGLGARDTLRLEAGYCLYGNDITTETNPFEAGLGWIVKLDVGDFIGRDALQDIKAAGIQHKLVGFVIEDRGIPRHGYPIHDPDGPPIGTVTSGSQSPMLDQGMGLGYVPNETKYTEPGQPLQIDAGRRRLAARVVKPPFHTD
jgi:aminomethyltransferase